MISFNQDHGCKLPTHSLQASPLPKEKYTRILFSPPPTPNTVSKIWPMQEINQSVLSFLEFHCFQPTTFHTPKMCWLPASSQKKAHLNNHKMPQFKFISCINLSCLLEKKIFFKQRGYKEGTLRADFRYIMASTRGNGWGESFESHHDFYSNSDTLSLTTMGCSAVSGGESAVFISFILLDSCEMLQSRP